MNPGHKHHTNWTFGSILWHKVTGDRGMVIAIHLRPESKPSYSMVFEDNREETSCMEFELTDEQPAVKVV